MSLVNTLDLTTVARREGFAVAAVNVVDDLSARAAVFAAEQAESPIILQTSVKTLRRAGVSLMSSMLRTIATGASVPVALHLDHCPDRALISEVVTHGWSSVLFDASALPFDEAVGQTGEVVREAHVHGVTVESEIENIIGVEDGIGSDEALHSYTEEELAEAARVSGADMIAPQVGTAHGMYSAAPQLRFDRVAKLVSLTDRPVVLHGGTGLSDRDFRRFVEAGISKINISTALKHAYMNAAREHLEEAERRRRWEPTALFDQVAEAVTAVVGWHIGVFGGHGADQHWSAA
ncbi:class II fructose-bisphosphate aldolase [Pseudonocardia sp. C8]|uniref:class II fructose-bisphosphate aldolase n=1 Tax=Pseudonocardia sp. C8 TaxID=2762759 RepID=UPI001642D4F2|nr:class II fructose-bisphosphate aldolase [Pseudonocardia sp. C8]MBC3190331.1 class II fructose-bisphosphate aldolase [Pseudonocardia sp. C8]